MTDVVLILTTVPDGDAGEAMARRLVDERLAACVNLHGPMTSFYRWRGSVERETERQIIIKTTQSLVDSVRTRVAALHSSELPEFIVLDVSDGSPTYLDWVRESTHIQA